MHSHSVGLQLSHNSVLCSTSSFRLSCLTESQSNTPAMGVTFANLAFAQASIGRLEEAGSSFIKAQEAATTANDAFTLARVSEGLAAVYFRTGQMDSCIPLLKQAISLLSSAPRDTTGDVDRLVNKLSLILSTSQPATPNRSRPVSKVEQNLAENSLQVTSSSMQATAVLAMRSASASSSSSSSVLELPEVSSLSSSSPSLDDVEDGSASQAAAAQPESRQQDSRKQAAAVQLESRQDLPTVKSSAQQGQRKPPKKPKRNDLLKKAEQGQVPSNLEDASPARMPAKTQRSERGPATTGKEPTVSSSPAAPSAPITAEVIIHRRAVNADVDVSSPLMSNLVAEVKSSRQKKALAGFGTNTPTGLKLRQSALASGDSSPSPPITPSLRDRPSTSTSSDGRVKSSVCLIL